MKLSTVAPFAAAIGLMLFWVPAPAAEPPQPLAPVPSANQLAWIGNELTLFTHFGMNTYTGRGTGLGDEDPKLFNPAKLDCNQWVRVAKESGFKGIIKGSVLDIDIFHLRSLLFENVPDFFRGKFKGCTVPSCSPPKPTPPALPSPAPPCSSASTFVRHEKLYSAGRLGHL